MEYVTLNNGIQMPVVQFGVFQIKDEKTCTEAVVDAIKAGYRAIDTAASYGNEKAVGNAIRQVIEEGIVKREDLFIISKMWVQDMKDEKTAYQAVRTSLDNLGLDYLDMYLLHQAMGDYFAAYRGMEKAYKEGLLKAIGVSNFFPNVLVNFCHFVEIPPMVNQVELHPFFSQQLSVDTMKKYSVVPVAWGSLAEGKHNIFNHPVLSEIGNKYGKSAAQVALRWNIDRGVVVVSKSTHIERMKQNLDILDFKLTEDEVEAISLLTLDHSEIINHYDPNIVEFIVTRNIHD